MIKNCFLTVVACVLSTLAFSSSSPASQKMNEAEAVKLGTEAYIYGYPLITMDLTRHVMTNVQKPEGTRGPMGQFINLREYPTASFRDVTAPNADTLYSAAWLDLQKEPYVLHVPEEHGRYYLMPMLSAWTDVFSVPGKRTTGTSMQNFVISGPNWDGPLPKELTVIKSPTNIVWILGRTYCSGTAEDYKIVHQIQDEYKVIPLSSYGKSYTPPKGKVDASIDMKTPVRDQVNNLDAATYFQRLAMLLKTNPPAKADAPMVAKLAKLGIIPGQNFNINQLNPEAINGLKKAVQAGQEKIIGQSKKAGEIKNGWVFTTKTGQYGQDYLQRAYIAAIGLGANLPQDAIYPTTTIDSSGQKLNGKNNYIIHFAKGNLPPVKGFWSLTMYDDHYFFVDNPLNKYSVNERNGLIKNSDGGIDLYIQNKSPGKDKESNWLPAPIGNFILMFRFYWPDDSIINGQWSLPMVKKSEHSR